MSRSGLTNEQYGRLASLSNSVFVFDKASYPNLHPTLRAKLQARGALVSYDIHGVFPTNKTIIVVTRTPESGISAAVRVTAPYIWGRIPLTHLIEVVDLCDIQALIIRDLKRRFLPTKMPLTDCHMLYLRTGYESPETAVVRRRLLASSSYFRSKKWMHDDCSDSLMDIDEMNYTDNEHYMDVDENTPEAQAIQRLVARSSITRTAHFAAQRQAAAVAAQLPLARPQPQTQLPLARPQPQTQASSVAQAAVSDDVEMEDVQTITASVPINNPAPTQVASMTYASTSDDVDMGPDQSIAIAAPPTAPAPHTAPAAIMAPAHIMAPAQYTAPAHHTAPVHHIMAPAQYTAPTLITPPAHYTAPASITASVPATPAPITRPKATISRAAQFAAHLTQPTPNAIIQTPLGALQVQITATSGITVNQPMPTPAFATPPPNSTARPNLTRSGFLTARMGYSAQSAATLVPLGGARRSATSATSSSTAMGPPIMASAPPTMASASPIMASASNIMAQASTLPSAHHVASSMGPPTIAALPPLVALGGKRKAQAQIDRNAPAATGGAEADDSASAQAPIKDARPRQDNGPRRDSGPADAGPSGTSNIPLPPTITPLPTAPTDSAWSPAYAATLAQPTGKFLNYKAIANSAPHNIPSKSAASSSDAEESMFNQTSRLRKEAQKRVAQNDHPSHSTYGAPIPNAAPTPSASAPAKAIRPLRQTRDQRAAASRIALNARRNQANDKAAQDAKWIEPRYQYPGDADTTSGR